MENVSKIKINVLQKNIYKIRLVFSVFGQGFLQLPRCYLRNGKEIAQLILKKNWMCERKDDLYKECKPGVPIHSNGQVLKVMVKRALEADEVEETPCQRPKKSCTFFLSGKKKLSLILYSQLSLVRNYFYPYICYSDKIYLLPNFLLYLYMYQLEKNKL